MWVAGQFTHEDSWKYLWKPATTECRSQSTLVGTRGSYSVYSSAKLHKLLFQSLKVPWSEGCWGEEPREKTGLRTTSKKEVWYGSWYPELARSKNLPKLYICIKLLQLCPFLCNPMDCSQPASSVHGILEQEYWRGLPCPPLGDLPHWGIELKPLTSPALADGFFTVSATWEIHPSCKGFSCQRNQIPAQKTFDIYC